MRPNRIILVRHGESLGNLDKTIYANIPDYAVPLTQKGVEQSLDVGNKIRNIVKNETCKFYVSTHKRTVQTYENIIKAFDPVQLEKPYFDPRLREQEWGNFRSYEANELIDAERNSFGAFHYRFPNGESCADVYDRMCLFLDTLHRYFDKLDSANNIVIVSHGRTMRVFLMRWFKTSVEEFESYRNPKNCQFIILDKTHNDKYEINKDCALDRYEKNTHKWFE